MIGGENLLNNTYVDEASVFNPYSRISCAMIVRSTIDMAHNLSLTVVAEGVENAVVYNALKKLGCDEAQGYLIGKPIPAADYLDWRVQWNRQLDQNRRESGLSIPIPLA